MAGANRLSNLVAGVLVCVTVGLVGCNSGPRPSPEEARNNSALAAAKAGHESRVNSLLGEGVNVNLADSNGETLLHLAASNGHDDLVQDLISKGASVNAQDAAGNTPLHLAAMNGHPKCSIALLGAGASKTARNKDGKTPADIASPKVKGLVVP